MLASTLATTSSYLQTGLGYATSAASTAGSTGYELAKNVSPKTALVSATGIVAGVAIAPIAGPAVLGVVGFSAAGPVAGTLAAGLQASIGNVVVGSVFAGAQSVAMGGAMPVIGSAISGGIVGSAVTAAKKCFFD